jgi:hypothetical protein
MNNREATKVYNNGYYDSTVAINSDVNNGGGLRYQTGCGPLTGASPTTTTPGAGDSYGPYCSNYYTTNGQLASTTHNPTGIYDMAGGVWEYQLAVLTCSSDTQLSTGSSTTYNSGFSAGAGNANNCYSGTQSPTQPTNSTPWPDLKYLTIYPASTFTGDYFTNNNSCTWLTCAGQALHETKLVWEVETIRQSWGNDDCYFVPSDEPWFERGGAAHYGSIAGVFASENYYGLAGGDLGWRSALW